MFWIINIINDFIIINIIIIIICFFIKTLSNNFSNIRNKKLILKKYFTNSKFNQRNSYPRNQTITDNYSQLPLKNKNQLNSSLADDMDMDININNNPKTKTLNVCHRIEYYNKNTHGNFSYER